MTRAATIRACVESRPPDTPMTALSMPVACKRVTRPWTWMLYTSSQRSCQARRIGGDVGEARDVPAQRNGLGLGSELETDLAHLPEMVSMVVDGVGETSHPHPLGH